MSLFSKSVSKSDASAKHSSRMEGELQSMLNRVKENIMMCEASLPGRLDCHFGVIGIPSGDSEVWFHVFFTESLGHRLSIFREAHLIPKRMSEHEWDRFSASFVGSIQKNFMVAALANMIRGAKETVRMGTITSAGTGAYSSPIRGMHYSPSSDLDSEMSRLLREELVEGEDYGL